MKKQPERDISALVDSYIEKAQPFAQPILRTARELIHRNFPQLTEEWKWTTPVYSYKGSVCLIWAFKKHAAIYFFKGALLADPYKVLQQAPEGNVSARHIKWTDIGQFDAKTIREYISEALMINEMGLKVKDIIVPKKLDTPDILLKALKKNKTALKVFDNLPKSHQKEYILWINDAKRDETKIKRVEAAICKLNGITPKPVKK